MTRWQATHTAFVLTLTSIQAREDNLLASAKVEEDTIDLLCASLWSPDSEKVAVAKSDVVSLLEHLRLSETDLNERSASLDDLEKIHELRSRVWPLVSNEPVPIYFQYPWAQEGAA